MKEKDKKVKNKYNVDTGFSVDGLPYARIGNHPNILFNLEALSFKNEPSSGIALRLFIKFAQAFTDEYTVYLVGRKQNVPESYTFEDMADDYAKMIRREFKEPVIIMGVSTGGQIAQYLAANHPDIVQKLIIISTAYRVSEKGAEIENQVAEYFKQEKYGKAFATMLDLIWSSRIARSIAKFLTRIFGKMVMGKIEYPNDLLTEIRGDIEMNFKDRLKEIQAPTLVLSGESDIEYTADLVRETAESIPNAKLILYKDYGHNLSMANRKQLQKDILEFLKS
ncbi:MAG: alpha/beta hydrolase [Candidatus Lokiarchaeota archaeon]|nr:alpha/beta hydrolase [Candidatus Lokiarchaeota archaeon]